MNQQDLGPVFQLIGGVVVGVILVDIALLGAFLIGRNRRLLRHLFHQPTTT